MEVTLTNKDESGMLHNVDFHAVTGPGGGAAVLTTGPPPFSPTKTATFKLLRPGLFIYHCSVTPVGVHMSKGMFGLILVEPEEGLPPVDKEFYVVQVSTFTSLVIH
jgi:nitrite reductase (NO-forming)